jgi:hypothetical protein
VLEIFLNRRSRICLASIALVPLTSAAASAAPAGLLGKTVTLGYSQSVLTKFPDGAVKTTTKSQNRTIYISSTGRVFMRTTRRNNANESDLRESGPEQTAGSVRFAGDTLLGTVPGIVGATQFSIKFDAGFQSCSAQVVTGFPPGSRHVWRGIGGQTLEAVGEMTTTANCSVAAGNGL